MKLKLSKRSITYLSIVAKFPEGKDMCIPWSTECILRRNGLITKIAEEHGASVLKITPYGIQTLKELGGEKNHDR
jgi:hypothetical protein